MSDWRERAACAAPGVDPDWFTGDVLDTERALAICAGCPVLEQCRAEAQGRQTQRDHYEVPNEDEGAEPTVVHYSYEVELRGVFGGEVYLTVAEQIYERFHEGEPMLSIAADLGISYEAALDELDDLMEVENYATTVLEERAAERAQQCVEVWQTGVRSLTDVAEMTGLSRATVRKHLTRAGLYQPPVATQHRKKAVA